MSLKPEPALASVAIVTSPLRHNLLDDTKPTVHMPADLHLVTNLDS